MDVERVSEYLLAKFMVEEKLDHLDFLKCKLGLELLLINLSIIALIYTAAFLTGMIKETAAVHIPYMILRNFAFGVHSESSLRCSLYSLLFFIGIPGIIKNGFILEESGLILLFGILFVLIAVYAPGDSSKYKVGVKRRKKLKKESILVFLLFGAVMAMGIPLLYKNLIFAGLAIEILMVIPLAKKIII